MSWQPHRQELLANSQSQAPHLRALRGADVRRAGEVALDAPLHPGQRQRRAQPVACALDPVPARSAHGAQGATADGSREEREVEMWHAFARIEKPRTLRDLEAQLAQRASPELL